MALWLPQSTFVGIDASARHIAEAQAAFQALDIHNIAFNHLDILDITPDFGQFDYIIAHGVYSWVPAQTQDKILDICRHNLAPQGIAFVSATRIRAGICLKWCAG
jgi:2-polyprenyl-3-methyl-5-hydroxy-6-metoxy-1,4-benzoquinol methylase